MWKLFLLQYFNMINTFCNSFIVFFTENKWYDHPWGLYLGNSATLVFAKFEIFMHLTFAECNT